MKKSLIVFLVLLTSLMCFAHVEKTYYLKGRVGDRDLAVKMLCYDEMPTRYIYYFFSNDKKDRLLIGNLKNTVWNFVPMIQQEEKALKPANELNITETPGEIWKGHWIDSAGKTWELVLTPILNDSSHKPFTNELDPYDSYRLSNVRFKKTRSDKQDLDLFCDWYLEKESGISFFRIRSTNKKLKTDSINAALEANHMSLVQKSFQYIPEKTATKVETYLLYLSAELVSFRVVLTHSFKTGKTSQTRDLFTLDIHSGQPVNLEDLVWFDKQSAKPSMSDLFKIYKYRKTIFSPKIFSLLKELYPGRMETDSCGINNADTWTLPAWNLTRRGIAFGFRAGGECHVEEWAIIPYEKLEPFMEGKYHLK